MAKMITCPTQMTKEWLKETLQMNLKEDSIEVLQLEQFTVKNGVCSSTFKAQVKIKEKLQNLFIKSILDKNIPHYIFYQI